MFFCKVPFENRQLLRVAGWQWNPVMKRWTTPDVSKVTDFTAFCSGKARAAVEAYNQGGGSVVLASMATDSDIEIPAPPGQEYRPFQRAGMAYALAKANVLIADPPGLGKTIQAIGTSNAMRSATEILILCPAYLKKNWEREFRLWDTNNLTIGHVETKVVDKMCDNGLPMRKPPTKAGKLGARIKETINIWPDTDVVISGIELLKRHEKAVKMRPWDLFIVDECDDYCNIKTQRSQFVFGGGRGKSRQYPIKATKRLFLTGTPIQTKPANIWNFCRQFDPQGLGRDWLAFVMRYCDAYNEGFGINTSGSSNLEELNLKLREAFMVRRNKKEVLHELPDKTREIVLLPNDGLTAKIEKELNAIQHLMEEFEVKLGLRDSDPDKVIDALQYLFPEDINPDMSFEDVSKVLTPDVAVGFEKLATFRKMLALAKAPLVKEHVDGLLRAGEKVVLFCYHKDVAEYFKGYYDDHCAFITGKVSADKRQAEVDRFQDDPDCTIMIANMAAGGKGFTMTASNIVVFAELDWLPSVMEQAEDRIWRIGQSNACLILYMVVDGSLDAYMVDVLIARIDMISRALNMQEKKE